MSRWTRYDTADPLPPGLLLNVNTGDIYGTPTTIGEYNFTIRAYNFEGFEEFIDVSTVVSANPFIQSHSLNAIISGDQKLEFFKSVSNYRIPYEKLYRPFDPNFGIRLDPKILIQKYTDITPSQFQDHFLTGISSDLLFDKLKIVPVQDLDGSVRAYCLVSLFKDKTYKSRETVNLDTISQYLFQNGSPIPVFEPWQGLAYRPNINSNSFTIENHPFVTGDFILFNNQDVPSPFFNDTLYYVIVVDRDTIRLSQTQTGAENNVFIRFNVNEVPRDGVIQTRLYGIPLAYLNTDDFDTTSIVPPINTTAHLQFIQVGDELVVIDEAKYLR